MITNTNITLVDETNTYTYKLGLVGDVDNNGVVNTKDATAIQKYLGGELALTNEDMIVADTDGNGQVSIKDSSAIQKLIASVIDELPNGKVILLP